MTSELDLDSRSLCPDGSCIGGGTCHVGIQTSKGRFHNDPMLRHPSFDGLSLLAFRFKAGYRSP